MEKMQKCLKQLKKKGGGGHWAGNVLRNKACSATKQQKGEEPLDLAFSIEQ